MARIQADAGDNYGAQESLTFSLRTLDEQDTAHYKCLASDDNELGQITLNCRTTPGAIQNYNQANGSHCCTLWQTTQRINLRDIFTYFQPHQIESATLEFKSFNRRSTVDAVLGKG